MRNRIIKVLKKDKKNYKKDGSSEKEASVENAANIIPPPPQKE